MRQVIEKLEQGKAILYKVTVKEGLWIGETAQVFEDARAVPGRGVPPRRRRRRPGPRHRPRGRMTWRATFFPKPTWCARTSRPREMAALMVRRFRAEFQQRVHLAGQGYRLQPAPGGDPGLADREGDRQPRRAFPGLLGVPQPPAAEHAPRLRLDHHLRPEKSGHLRRRTCAGTT